MALQQGIDGGLGGLEIDVIVHDFSFQTNIESLVMGSLYLGG
jgi:hypothetical protein